jgi:hypothetical protein
MPADSQILDRNLLALANTDPGLASMVTEAEYDPAIRFETARTGDPVPVLRTSNRDIFLHSRFDPRKEARRLCDSYPNGGYFVFLGFGGAYQILPFLEKTDTLAVTIIVRRLGHFRTVLAHLDLRKLLMDPRVSILVDPDHVRLHGHILNHYHPALLGDMHVVPLRSIYDVEPETFEAYITEIREVLGNIADDYTVQTRFGKRWFINTIMNLPFAEISSYRLPQVKRAAVTGAGPSLDIQLPHLRRIRDDVFLIATDTSLPCLGRNGIVPDLVISIDCQHVTYHHFLDGIPEGVPLLLDLASPPSITRLTDRLLFFQSGHPFSQYVARYWRQFPYIDITGGNVSHAAVSLSDELGAEEIILFGLDFSYPEGKTYAKGTYVYRYFRKDETRLRPCESQAFAFLLRNENIIKEPLGSVFRYTTKPMISYKERLERVSGSLSARLHQVEGIGLELRTNSPLKRRPRNLGLLFSAGASDGTWMEFVSDYLDRIRNLPDPSGEYPGYLTTLDTMDLDLWKTMYPAAASIRRELPEGSFGPLEVMSKARDWTVRILGQALNRG